MDISHNQIQDGDLLSKISSGYEDPGWLDEELVEDIQETTDHYELRDGRKIEGYSSEEEYLDKDNKTVTEVKVHHGSSGLEQPRGQRDFESDSDSESTKSVSSKSDSSKSSSSSSPSPKLRSRSPSPKLRSRSPSPKLRSRSPSPKLRSRSPSPKPVALGDHVRQQDLRNENSVHGINDIDVDEATVTTDKSETVEVCVNIGQEMSDSEDEKPKMVSDDHFEKEDDEEFNVFSDHPSRADVKPEHGNADSENVWPEMAQGQSSFDRPKTARDKRRLPGAEDEALESPKHQQPEVPSILILGDDSKSSSSDHESDAATGKPQTEPSVTRFDSSDDEALPDNGVLQATTTTMAAPNDREMETKDRAETDNSDREAPANESASQNTEFGKTSSGQLEIKALVENTTEEANWPRETITDTDTEKGSLSHEPRSSDTDADKGEKYGKESSASSPTKSKSEAETGSGSSSDSDSDSDSSTERSTSRSSRSTEDSDSESEDEAGGRDPDGVADGPVNHKELLSTVDVQRGERREGSILSLVDNGESVNISNVALDNDQVKELRDYIEQNSNLREVVIRNGSLGEVDIQRLAFSLKQCPSHIKMLNLNLNKIGATGAGKVAEVLKVKPSIEVLMLHGNPLGDDGIKALVDGLLRIHGEEKQSNFIRRLSMEEERLAREVTQNAEVYTTIAEEAVEEEEVRETTPQELKELMTEIDELEKKAQLIGLDSDDPKNGAVGTASELQESVSVAVLTAAHEVADQLIDSAFRDAMKSDMQLDTQGEVTGENVEAEEHKDSSQEQSAQDNGNADMGKNKNELTKRYSETSITDNKSSENDNVASPKPNTMSSIMEQKFCHLKELDLGETGMTDVGLGDLAVLLAQNTDLRSLNLTDNKTITQFGWKKLGKGLEINEKLERLTLDYCYVGDSGLNVILDAIKDHPSLRNLDLVCTGLTERSGRYLVELLKRNTFLTEITLMPGNEIPDRTMDEIRNYLALNRNMLNK